MPIPRPIRSVAGEGSSRPRALPPIHLPSPSAAGRLEPVLRRFEPVRADSSSSTGPPPQGCQAGGPAGPLRSSLTQARSLDLARIRQGLVRQLPATTFLSGGFPLEAVVRLKP
uniref:Uncharacterized protein n=1 Tax=Setaria italica TaxID=4555 RepID=K3XTT3_SETIT